MAAPYPDPVTTQHTFCRICEALCGLEVDVQAGRAVDVRPDAGHATTRGFACIKGLQQHHMYGSPDRLRHPLARGADGKLTRVSWGQALAKIGTSVKALRRDHGPNSIGMYVGTAAGFGVLHPIFAQGFMTGVGSASMYSSATQDCSNKFAVARHLYGFPFTQPFPDVARSNCLIIVGANPVVSKWSFLQVPNPGQQLKAIAARGHLFVVDPRRTETAKLAGEHVFIRPGSDVFFYAAFLNELIAQGGVDDGQVGRHTRGFEQVARLVSRWTAERAAEVSGIDAATLRRMVQCYRQADGAALYSSTGVNMGGAGALSFWLQEVINAVSGNLDRAGGTLVGHGILDFPGFGAKHGVLLRDDTSRVGGFASVNDTFPGGLLADEILTEGPGQLKALFVTGGNPLLTMAGSGRLREALRKLELLVVLDILPTETASEAHVVLPCTTPFERPDLPFIFPLMLGLQSVPYLQATEAIHQPDGEQCDEASIYLALARACGTPLFGSRALQLGLQLAARRATPRADRPTDAPRPLPQQALLSLLLRLSGQPSYSELLRHPHGLRRAPHNAGDFLGERVHTADGRVDLAPAPLIEQAAELEPRFAELRRERGRLRLITKREVSTHNSWTHNHPRFVRGARNTNYLYIHPDDAARAGLSDGSFADVRSATDTVRLPVKLSDDLAPGTVALPHGWGHQHASGLTTASRTRGVNVNLLAADGPAALCRVSGMAQLTAIRVEVAPAAGPANPNDWAGV